MKASVIRQITRFLPLPSGMVINALDRYEKMIEYPELPVVISVNNGEDVIEVKNIREMQQRRIYFLDRYESREIKLCKKLLSSGDIFIDVGANIGWFTIGAARQVGQAGKVIAFEPSSQINPQLQRNIYLNKLSNVKVEKIALSDENGTAILSGYTEENIGLPSIVGNSDNYEKSGSEKVETVRFDDYYQRASLGKIRLIKIDAEGAEMKILEGMGKLLEKKDVDCLIIEVREEAMGKGKNAEEVMVYLENYGYSIFEINMFGIKPLKANAKPAFQGGYVNILAKALNM